MLWLIKGIKKKHFAGILLLVRTHSIYVCKFFSLCRSVSIDTGASTVLGIISVDLLSLLFQSK